MAYDGPGYRDEPEYRHAQVPYEPGYSAEGYRTGPEAGGSYRQGAANASLDDMFDDPEHGEPGRDRMGVHVVWELILLVGVGVLGFLFWREHPELLRGQELRLLLVFTAALGLVALGAGLSLRVAVPNLAVGPVAVASALYYAKGGSAGTIHSTTVILGVGAALGLAIAFLVVVFHVPGWAATLAGALVVVVWIQKQPGSIQVSGGYDATDHAYYLFGGFAALAVLGGLVGSIRSVRRALGRYRPIEDPARRRGAFAGVLAGVALICSTALASVGGVLLAAHADARELPVIAGAGGWELTGLALGAVLVGGTSAFGRRGGVFGTLFAVLLLAIFLRFEESSTWRISWYAIAAALVAAGLVITRLVEAMGRPRARYEDEDTDDTWMPSGGTPPPQRQDWSSSLPAQPSAGSSQSWSERW